MRSLQFLLLGFVLGYSLDSPRAYACAKNGFCDLSAEDWQSQESRELKDEWKFYWKQLLTPLEITEGRAELTGFLDPASDWNNTNISGIQLHSSAYATYYLEFNVADSRPLTLRIPLVASAGRMWLNDNEIARVGTVATERSDEIGRKHIVFHSFVPKIGINSITIQMSSFGFFTRGNGGRVRIGPISVIADAYQRSIIRDAITFGSILIMAFYHFYLWAIRRTRFAPLYFGLFCLAVGLRSITSGDSSLLNFFVNDVSMELFKKFEYIGASLGFAAITLLINELYPKECKRRISHPVCGVTSLWFFVILLSSADFYPRQLSFFQFLMVTTGTYAIAAVTLAVYRRREGARVFMVGFGIFFGTAIYDILISHLTVHRNSLSHIGTFCFIFFQAILLSKRFDQAFDQAEQAEKKVRLLNEGLEHMVKERTEQINTILANVSSGFLLIDRHGRLLPGFTDSCRHLLGVELEAGRPLADLLTIDQDTKARFTQAFIQVIEDLMPVEVSLSQLPDRVNIFSRTLSVAAAALRTHDSGKLKAILFTINDVSTLKDAERQVQYNQMLLNIIQEKESFVLFLRDFEQEFKLAMGAVHLGEQSKVRSFLHTTKGNLSAFGVNELVDKIHQIESNETILAQDLRLLSDFFRSLLNKNSKILDIESFDSAGSGAGRIDIPQLLAFIDANINPSERSQLSQFIRKLARKPIRNYLGPLRNNALNLAMRLGKELRCDIQGDDLHVDEGYSRVLRSLIHLVRNSIDHGIELPEDRIDKSSEGLISLSFTLEKSGLKILIEDDGQGLNYQNICQKAKELRIIAEDSEKSDAEIAQLIMLPNFSTVNQITDISGRGIGMAAVAEAVNELRGTIQITSQPGRGVCVTINLPALEGQDEQLAKSGTLIAS